MSSAMPSWKFHPISALAPLFLAVVILLAPLASGYSWVSGGHAGESHVHRHHLLEKLAPNSHHHTMARPSQDDAGGTAGNGAGWSVVLHGFPGVALTAAMSPAFLPEPVSYFESAAAALLAVAVVMVIISYNALVLRVGVNRPQTRPNPLDRPPTA